MIPLHNSTLLPQDLDVASCTLLQISCLQQQQPRLQHHHAIAPSQVFYEDFLGQVPPWNENGLTLTFGTEHHHRRICALIAWNSLEWGDPESLRHSGWCFLDKTAILPYTGISAISTSWITYNTVKAWRIMNSEISDCGRVDVPRTRAVMRKDLLLMARTAGGITTAHLQVRHGRA